MNMIEHETFSSDELVKVLCGNHVKFLAGHIQSIL